ncbi:MAG: HAD family phosphatase [Acidobacteriota bacterium]
MIRGLIFDMDGVLVDNAQIHTLAWQQLGKEAGIDLRPEAVRAVFGQRNREMMAALLGVSLNVEEQALLARRKETLYRQLMAPVLKPTPGAIDFLKRTKNSGFKTAVATSGPIENTDLVLDGLKIRPLFDTIVTGGDVARGKPDPEIFLLAAQRLDLPASECLVFEDSAAGIEASFRAGCLCIALATTHTPQELQEYPAARIISDFTQLTVCDLSTLDK